MTHFIYTGSVYHKRFLPVEHAFKYPVYFFSLKLSDLEHLKKYCFGLGINRFNFFSFHEKDYLHALEGTLNERVKLFLKQQKVDADIDDIQLVTTPKFLGMGFNPVSFFYCYSNQVLRYVIAEVNNTFRQSHTYLLKAEEATKSMTYFSAEKQFHVSPFFTVEGDYKFKLSALDKEALLVIDYYKDNTNVACFTTR